MVFPIAMFGEFDFFAFNVVNISNFSSTYSNYTRVFFNILNINRGHDVPLSYSSNKNEDLP